MIISLFISEQLFFFYNTIYLDRWHKSAESTKKNVPGHYYFSKIFEFVKVHFITGELFFEFRKYSCHSEEPGRKHTSCRFCKMHHVVGPVPDPFPPPVSNQETKHYKRYEETPQLKDNLKMRDVHDFQARARLKHLFIDGEITSEDKEKLNEFATKYFETVKLVTDYLLHLQNLKFRREKRMQERKKGRQTKLTENFQHKRKKCKSKVKSLEKSKQPSNIVKGKQKAVEIFSKHTLAQATQKKKERPFRNYSSEKSDSDSDDSPIEHCSEEELTASKD